jgi:sigma-B regulation protein RsbU (phosphoserine phosphatase)
MSDTPRLQISDAMGPRVVTLDKPLFRIGRRHESELRLLSADVSREHAEIERQEGGRWLLRDCKSRHGTFANEQPITEHFLAHGDRIRLGRSGAEMVFLLDEAAPAHAPNTSSIVDFRQIASILDGLRALGSARVLDEVLALVMDSAIAATGADRGFIMLATPDGQLEFKIGRAAGRLPLSGNLFDMSRKIPQQVFATGEELMVTDLMDGSVAGDHMGTVALGIRHVLCAPLKAVRYVERPEASPEHRPIGVLYLDSRSKGRLLSTATRRAVEALVTEATGAIQSARLYREAAEKTRLEKELDLAAEIQRALLPQTHQSGAYYEIASASIPCRAIGGDFFDYFNLQNDDFGFVLGDVAGKGPSAALLTAMIQGIFAAQVGSASSPAALMASVNTGLIRRALQSRFATVLYGRLSADGRLTYCNGGHNPPVLLTGAGVKRLETGGLILGLFAQATYQQETIALAPGDVLVVYSDGVTEALDPAGQDFGEERLLACLEANRTRPPAELLDRVLSSVRSFVGGAAQHDDVTALVLRYRS